MRLRKCALIVATTTIFVPFFVFGQSNVETVRCSIQSQPGTVAAGEDVKLTWSSFGAKSASIEGIGSVQTSGTRTVTPSASRTYKLTVRSDKNKEYSCETAVTVVAARPSCFISVWPMSITEGQNATVSWGSSHATSLFITDLGSVQPSGTRTVRPLHTTTYALTAKGTNGTCTETARIVVNKPQSNYGYFPNVIKTLVSPFVPQSNKSTQNSNNNNTTYEDTWYFDDKNYDEWEGYEDYVEEDYYYDPYGSEAENEYHYGDYSSFESGTYEEDEYYYDNQTYDSYGESYYETEEFYDNSNDCWWDYWCGNSSLNDTVEETYDEWDSNYNQGVGYDETYYEYDENQYFNDTVYYYYEE